MHLTCEIRTIEGTTLGVLLLQPKTFKSGRKGYFGQGKIEMNGVRFQSQCQLVRIGEPEGAAAVEDEG